MTHGFSTTNEGIAVRQPHDARRVVPIRLKAVLVFSKENDASLSFVRH